MKDLNIKKLYYSISEVSQITSLKPYVLRYWESEFPQLKPTKNRAGNRIYKSHDIDTIALIKKLLYTDKFTIEGARQELDKKLSEQKKTGSQLDFSFRDGNNQQIIDELKQHLNDIVKLFEPEEPLDSKKE
ncbi:MAG: MerR family transcriptional regulator [bacterium]